jgi:hypothetical protein
MTHAVASEGRGSAGYGFEVYVWTYVFVNIFILLNILLAILVAGYTDIAASSYESKSVVEDLYEYFVYYFKKMFVPRDSFISDERLLEFVEAELVGFDRVHTDGGLRVQARASSRALDTRATILLGRGMSMGKRETKALVRAMLQRAEAPPAAGRLSPPGGGLDADRAAPGGPHGTPTAVGGHEAPGAGGGAGRMGERPGEALGGGAGGGAGKYIEDFLSLIPRNLPKGVADSRCRGRSRPVAVADWSPTRPARTDGGSGRAAEGTLSRIWRC